MADAVMRHRNTWNWRIWEKCFLYNTTTKFYYYHCRQNASEMWSDCWNGFNNIAFPHKLTRRPEFSTGHWYNRFKMEETSGRLAAVMLCFSIKYKSYALPLISYFGATIVLANPRTSNVPDSQRWNRRIICVWQNAQIGRSAHIAGQFN